MADTYDFGTTSEVRTTDQGGRIQAISATYFNITDVRAWPVAGLLLLQDSGGHPVRAELHVDESIPEHVEDTAIRQARRLLSQQFSGEEDLEMRVVRTYQVGDPFSVPLMGTGLTHTEESESQIPWMGIAAAVAMLFVLTALVWAGLTFLRNGSTTTAPADTSSAIEGQAASESNAAEAPSGAANQSAPAAASENNSVGSGSLACQNSGLAVSRNARDDIVVGQRVRIQPGYQLTLRSLPGAEAGDSIGYMLDEEQATVLDGPVCTQGDSDSIVWWYLKLDSGIEAWAAANTSQYTLLVPTVQEE